MRVLHILTPVIIAIALVFTINIRSYECTRILDEEEEHWMIKTDDTDNNNHLVLQSLQKGSVRPPGNGCTKVPGQGGNRCTYEINQKGFAGHVMAQSPPPTSQAYPQFMSSFGVAAKDDQLPK